MVACKYCGKEFTKKHNRQVYCCKECSKKAKREQDNNSWHKWYHKNKHRLSEKTRWGLGSGTIGAKAYTDDFEKELNVIQTELNRRGLRRNF